MNMVRICQKLQTGNGPNNRMKKNSVILCLNSGSSSLKFALYSTQKTLQLLVHGEIENIDQKKPFFWIQHNKKKHTVATSSLNTARALSQVLDTLKKFEYPMPLAIAHRVVHGGSFFSKPTRINSSVLQKLKTLIHFAPLHLPSSLKMIEAIQKWNPKIPQIACFDTAIYHAMPKIAKQFPLPEKEMQKGIQRYGFHGLSYESILEQLQKEKAKKIIIAHLGNGSSMTAFYQGKPVDTTMGLTPTSGIMMGTRSGDLDPGLLIFLMREKKYSVKTLENLLNYESGLKGVSGISEDMQQLLRSKNPSAKNATELFCYQAQKAIGSLSTVLGGLDLLIFTGGIGENSSQIRKQICQPLKFLQIELDTHKNRSHQQVISQPSSGCIVKVLKTDEDAVLAKHAWQILKETL